jgi:RHH-type transcriptional regulator, proline utilization regulon repressor / proline dehydrogenase / delta 1-pyrroline-5-carboxylate dehydrogenase
MNVPFENEPALDLRHPAARADSLEALARLDAELPVRVPVLIGSDRSESGGLRSVDPCAPERTVAIAAVATFADVARATQVASDAASDWGARSAEDRAAVLLTAAGILRRRRPYLTALVVREAAKPWAQADAEVCEAIDFLEYYAGEAVALDPADQVISLPGERNTMRWVGRGVTAVIAPWNFPVAIACGMVSAALVTGNAVILKPAEQTPGCGYEVVRALREAGLPDGALNFLPGYGDVGAALVRDPRVHVIAFTGSCAVGLEIVAAAASVGPAQKHLKSVVAEMGGKNCMVVDADADLDDAVVGIIDSAFGFAGQKCSAASRVIAHEAVAATLVERLAGAVAALRVGPAEDFSSDLSAVIDEDARERVLGFVALASEHGRVLAEGGPIPAHGWYCAPTLVSELPASSPLLREEFFGPLLTFETASSLEEACRRIDELPFALTAGLYSRDPVAVATAAVRIPAGNFYVNRATTGAMVGRQPFGGNRLSGTGSKAGGPGYLLRFVEPRVMTENTVRHGLVVSH